MGLHWGIDSYSPANTMVRIPAAHLEPGESASTRLTIFDYVTRRMGRRPEFWGRYLNGNPRVAERRLRAPLFLLAPEAELHGAIAIALIRPNLDYGAWTRFDSRHRDDGTVLGEQLGHADLLAY